MTAPPPSAPAQLPSALSPTLVYMTRVVCAVAPVVSLGGPAKHGERRYVPLGGGSVSGPELEGTLVEGGVDWQVQRVDGATDIAAHYVIRTADGALVEVQSEGLRHGPPEVMARLARGEAVAPHEYYFRTLMRFTTGAPAWLHLNKVLALAAGQRERDRVVLDVWRIG